MAFMNNQSSENPYVSWTFVKWVCGICVFVIGASSVAFFWKRDIFEFGDGYVLDNELWGTLGDFIGGLLGAILAALSFLMMYWTLKDQRDLSKINNSLSELQRFNDVFFELLSLYNRQIAELKPLDSPHSFFTQQMKVMQKEFKEYTTFGRARRYAREKYLNFYLENAEKIAPIFRTLYRLFCLIDKAQINDKEKLEYAKTVRAQLSEGELFFLRYNCLTNYGNNFIDFINKYRVTKHLPFLSLLENTTLRNKLTTSGINRGLALNSLTYLLGKEIFNRMVKKTDINKKLETIQENAKYRLSILVVPSKTVIIQLRISTNRRNQTPALRCLDSLDIDMKNKLLYDIIREIILYSNSEEYNDPNQIYLGSKRQDNGDVVTIWSFARAHDDYNIRISHPDWDGNYGIINT